ncbi:MAG: hypothetical protein RR466_11550 [Hungatella sp.]
MIYHLYPVALDCGISIDAFWEMSLGEVEESLESHHRRELYETRQRLREKHFLARDIAQCVSIAISGGDGAEPAQLWDYFPDLFEEEKKAYEAELQRHNTEVYEAQMRDFAYRHNYARTGGEGA